MASVEIQILELLATWLGAGRLVAGADALDNRACFEHVAAVCALRSTRRWEVITSVRMLVSVHAGRSAWLLSTYRLTRAVHDTSVADLVRQNVFAGLEITRLNAVEGQLQQRIHGLQDRVQEFSDLAQGFEIQLWELRAALRDAPRAE
jgi:hypothetical protein